MIKLLTSFQLTVCLLLAALAGPSPASPPPVIVRLPSAVRTGSAVDDTIWVTLYRAAPAANAAPAVILIHPIGQSPGDVLDRFMHRLAGQFADRGMTCAFMALPFHLQRGLRRENTALHFIGPDAGRDVQALEQSSADVSTVFTWLSRQSDVDARRIGVVGISLGAIVAHLAMGQDSRLTAGVALEGGGDLPNLFRRSLEVRLHARYSARTLAEAREKLRAVEPTEFADRNRPRRVLMIEAARDLYVPPQNAVVLWEALGRPPIQWVDTNHFAFLLAGASFADTATAYLNHVWEGGADEALAVPHFRAPTIKVGLLFGLDSVATPALTWQFHSFASRPDHLSLVHADAGWSGRGPFAGLAVTLTPYIDVGVGHRLTGNDFRPYASLHVVF